MRDPLLPLDRLAGDAIEVTCGGTSYAVPRDRPLLDSLLQSGVDVPYACRKGTCFSCLMTCVAGEIPAEARQGLRPAQVRQGLFLACQHRPQSDLEVALADGPAVCERVVVSGKVLLSPEVCGLRLQPAAPFSYRAGQFVNLRRNDGLSRSYSLASVPDLDGDLEIHVKRLQNGAFSNWVFDRLEVGTTLDVQGPYGECTYAAASLRQPILLIGTGTGLAPLLGVVRDALHRGHSGEIHLYHGSRGIDGLYKIDALRALEQEHGNVFYHPCLSGPAAQGLRHRRAELAAFEDRSDLAGWSVYLCGYPAMVESGKQTAYLRGAALAEIHADPFELRDLRATARSGARPDRPDGW